MVDGSSSEDDQPKNVDEVEEKERDDLETNTEDDDVQIQYHLSDENHDSEDDDGVDDEDDR